MSIEASRDRLQKITEKLRDNVDCSFVVIPIIKDNSFSDKFFAGVFDDGTIRITYELINILDDDELAAVLAHEIAHLQSPISEEVAVARRQVYSSSVFRLEFGSDEKRIVKELLHTEEFYADARAVEILRKAGDLKFKIFSSFFIHLNGIGLDLKKTERFQLI